MQTFPARVSSIVLVRHKVSTYVENQFLPVILFADYHAKTEVGDKYGTTALIWAARKGRIDIAEMLLRAGASVDAVGMYSWTPLLVAARWEGWMQ